MNGDVAPTVASSTASLVSSRFCTGFLWNWEGRAVSTVSGRSCSRVPLLRVLLLGVCWQLVTSMCTVTAGSSIALDNVLCVAFRTHGSFWNHRAIPIADCSLLGLFEFMWVKDNSQVRNLSILRFLRVKSSNF